MQYHSLAVAVGALDKKEKTVFLVLLERVATVLPLV
jgi:hypothetical protein